MGRGVPGRRLRDASSRPTAPRTAVDRRARRCCPRRCAATRATCPQLRRLRQGRARRLPRRHARPTTRDGGAAARLRRLHPRRATSSSVSSYVLGPAAQDAARPVGLPGASSASALEAWGERARAWLRRAGEGHAQPASRRRRPVRPWPVDRARPRRSRAGSSRGRAGARRDRPRPPAPTTDELDLVEAARVAEWDDELDAAARRGARATAPTSSTCRCRRSLSATVARPAARRPRRASPATWPGRCRGSRRRRPGSAPASTPGSRPASASRTCSTPTSCPAAATPASTTTPTCAS